MLSPGASFILIYEQKWQIHPYFRRFQGGDHPRRCRDVLVAALPGLPVFAIIHGRQCFVILGLSVLLALPQKF